MTQDVTNFHFDAAAHRYTLNGVVLPSVTGVLEDVGIIDYSHLPPETRNMALTRGSNVHLATQMDDEGDLDEASCPGLMPYVEAWRAAKRHLGIERFEPEWIERRGYHPTFGYAGTLDRKHGDMIIDLKTSEAPWWVRIQLAAYQSMVEKEAPNIVRRVAVALGGDRSFKVHEFGQREYRRDLNVFNAALLVMTEKQQNRRETRC